MPRLFTGIEIPPDIAFALSLKRGGLSGARWVDADNYHVTLSFIGDVTPALADDIADGLGVLEHSASFPVRISTLDAFGGDKPRALIAAVDPDPGLIAFQGAQARLLMRLGAMLETRKFIPHVTLARLGHASAPDVAALISGLAGFAPLAFIPSRFVLYSSRQGQGGGPYGIEARYVFAS